MANITTGMTILADWFITDTVGLIRKDKFLLEVDTNPLIISQNGVTLLELLADGVDDGKVKIKGDIETNSDF